MTKLWFAPPYETESDADPQRFGPETPRVEWCLEVVAGWTRDQIVRLDLAERRDAVTLEQLWVHLGDRIGRGPERRWFFEVRRLAWETACLAAAAHGMAVRPDTGPVWAVEEGIGFGAARVARYTTCAMVAPQRLDADLLEVVLRPWRSVLPDPLER